eukprot:RCo008276
MGLRRRLERAGDWLVQPINCFLALTWCLFGISVSLVIWGLVDVVVPPHTFWYIWDADHMVDANLSCANLILVMCALAQHPARILDTRYLWKGQGKQLLKRYRWYAPTRRTLLWELLL